MTPARPPFRHLLGGPALDAGTPWPLVLRAVLCDLRPRFLPKGVVGAGHRAVARNGRVLLCSDRPAAELAGQVARVRLQTWHRAILPGDVPEPYGILLCVRGTGRGGADTAGAGLHTTPPPPRPPPPGGVTAGGGRGAGRGGGAGGGRVVCRPGRGGAAVPEGDVTGDVGGGLVLAFVPPGGERGA